MDDDEIEEIYNKKEFDVKYEPFLFSSSSSSHDFPGSVTVAAASKSHGFAKVNRKLTNSISVKDPAMSICSSRDWPSLEYYFKGACYSSRQDYYVMLGVPKDANRDEIKKAYHELAKKCHPDRNKSSPAAKRKFLEIRDAYETLRYTEKREQYDMRFKSGSENTESNFGQEEAFRQAYKTHFSSSFHNFFSEVIGIPLKMQERDFAGTAYWIPIEKHDELAEMGFWR